MIVGHRETRPHGVLRVPLTLLSQSVRKGLKATRKGCAHDLLESEISQRPELKGPERKAHLTPSFYSWRNWGPERVEGSIPGSLCPLCYASVRISPMFDCHGWWCKGAFCGWQTAGLWAPNPPSSDQQMVPGDGSACWAVAGQQSD